jgi:hypothetical protein
VTQGEPGGAAAVRRPSQPDALILLLGTLLFVDSFLPWYRGSTPFIKLHFSVNAWDLGGRWMLTGVLALLAALMVVLPLIGLELLDDKRWAGLVVLDAGLTFLFALLAVAVRPAGDAQQALLGLERAPALYAAPLLAAALLAAALRKAKDAAA